MPVTILKKPDGSKIRRSRETLAEIIEDQLDKLKNQSKHRLLDSSEINILKTIVGALEVAESDDQASTPSDLDETPTAELLSLIKKC